MTTDLIQRLRGYLNSKNSRARVPWALIQQAVDTIADLTVQLAEAQDKALRFDLDRAGIEQREREAVELVTLRAQLAEAQRVLAAGWDAETVKRQVRDFNGMVEALRNERAARQQAEAQLVTETRLHDDALALAVKERNAAEAKRDRLRAALLDVEWGGHRVEYAGGEKTGTCPACGATEFNKFRSSTHETGCVVDAALRGTERA